MNGVQTGWLEVLGGSTRKIGAGSGARSTHRVVDDYPLSDLSSEKQRWKLEVYSGLSASFGLHLTERAARCWCHLPNTDHSICIPCSLGRQFGMGRCHEIPTFRMGG